MVSVFEQTAKESGIYTTLIWRMWKGINIGRNNLRINNFRALTNERTYASVLGVLGAIWLRHAKIEKKNIIESSKVTHLTVPKVLNPIT